MLMGLTFRVQGLGPKPSTLNPSALNGLAFRGAASSLRGSLARGGSIELRGFNGLGALALKGFKGLGSEGVGGSRVWGVAVKHPSLCSRSPAVQMLKHTMHSDGCRSCVDASGIGPNF